LTHGSKRSKIDLVYRFLTGAEDKAMASLKDLLKSVLEGILRPALVPVPIPVRVHNPQRRY
jgi:hypothetical protein